MASKNASPSIDTAWFKDRIVARKTSQRKLAKALGMDPAAMSLLLRGMRGVSPLEAEGLARELGVPLGEVLARMGVDATAGARNQVGIVARVSEAGEMRMGRPQEGARRVPAPEGMPEDAAAFRIESEGFADGWLGYYQPADSVVVEAIGRFCVAQVAGKDEWHARVVRRGHGKGTYNLQDPFGRSATIEGVRLASASPVLWIKC